MALDLRTDEQRAIDAVVEAKLAIDGPDAERWRSVVAEKREQLDGFVAASQKREQELLHRQAMERDEFSRAELSEHNQLQATLTVYADKLSKLAMNYASAVDALRAHYGTRVVFSDVAAGITGQGQLATVAEPVENIRRVLRGDLHGAGVDVRTFVNPDTGDLITRIRRGLHDMGAEGTGKPPEGFEPMSGELGAHNITEALQDGAKAIGEDLGALGLDFSLDAAEKG